MSLFFCERHSLWLMLETKSAGWPCDCIRQIMSPDRFRKWPRGRSWTAGATRPSFAAGGVASCVRYTKLKSLAIGYKCQETTVLRHSQPCAVENSGVAPRISGRHANNSETPPNLGAPHGNTVPTYYCEISDCIPVCVQIFTNLQRREPVGYDNVVYALSSQPLGSLPIGRGKSAYVLGTLHCS